MYRLRQGIGASSSGEHPGEVFRGLKQELGWVGHRHWPRGKVLGHLALGVVAHGLIEEMAHQLRLSFYGAVGS